MMITEAFYVYVCQKREAPFSTKDSAMKSLYFFLLISIFGSLPTFAQQPAYEVYALRFASAGPTMATSLWALNAPPKDSVRIDFSVWLIKGKNGKNILLDAGFLPDIEDAKDFGIINYRRPDSALLQLGIVPDAITDIIISHPHWDHIDAVGLFPKAQIWMQQEDFNYFVSSAWQKDGDHGGFNPRNVKEFIDLNLKGRLTLIKGDNQEILPGIKVFTGSRHTFNSQYVLVNTGSQKIVLASDNIWVYYSLDHLAPPSKGGTRDEAGYVNAMKRMKTLASQSRLIIPGHDAKVFSLFPAIADGIAKIQ